MIRVTGRSSRMETDNFPNTLFYLFFKNRFPCLNLILPYLQSVYSAGSQLSPLKDKTILDLSPLVDRTIADRIDRT